MGENILLIRLSFGISQNVQHINLIIFSIKISNLSINSYSFNRYARYAIKFFSKTLTKQHSFDIGCVQPQKNLSIFKCLGPFINYVTQKSAFFGPPLPPCNAKFSNHNVISIVKIISVTQKSAFVEPPPPPLLRYVIYERPLLYVMRWL